MKLLRIGMYNLASFEGEQVIDLESEPLKSADLFSIVGETGSGKSTVLDAVCLALYGLAPRFYGADNFDYYNTEKPDNDKVLEPDDPRNILRKGMKDCWAEVCFLARDGFRYRARWSCSVARVNYSRPVRRLFRIEADPHGRMVEKEVDITEGKRQKRGHKNVNNEALDRIIGLDYGQFTRTVMLAQNSFANFVKADDKDKAVLLEKLTGTELYTSIARKIYEFYKQAEEGYRLLSDQVKAFAVHRLDQEELDKTTALLEVQEKNIQEERQRALKIDEQLQWYNGLETLKTALEAEEQKWKHAMEHAGGLLPQRRELQRVEAVASIRDVFQNSVSLEKEVGKLSVDRDQLQHEVLSREEQVQKEKERVEQFRKGWMETRNAWEGWLPKLKEARRIRTEVNTRREQVDRQTADWKKRRQKYETISLEKQKNQVELDGLLRVREEAAHWLEEQEPYRPVWENMGVIAERLTQLLQWKERCQKESKAIEEEGNRLQEQQKAMEEMEQALKKSAEELAQLHEHMSLRQRELAEQDLERLQQNLEGVTEVYKTWEALEKMYQGACLLQQEQKRKQEEVLAGEKQTAQLEEEVAVLQQEQATIQQLLPGLEEAYQLVSGRTAADLRASLQPDQPCPVCGSTHHPYAEGVENVLLPIKKELDQRRERMEQLKVLLDRVPDGLLIRLATVKGQLAAHRTGLQQLETRWADTVAEWEREAVKCPELPSKLTEVLETALSTDWGELMGRKKAETVVRGKQLRAQVNGYLALQKELGAWRKQYDEQNLKQVQVQERLHQSQSEWQQRNGKCEQRKSELSDLQRAAADLHEQLCVQIALPGWSEEFDADAVACIQRLQAMAEKFRKTQTLLQETLGTVGERQALIRSQQSQLEGLQLEIQQGEKELEKESEEIRCQEKQWKDLLGGVEPDELERNWGLQLTEKEGKVAQAEKVLNELTERHQHERGKLRAMEGQLAEKASAHEEACRQVWTFIEEYNGRLLNHSDKVNVPAVEPEGQELLTVDWLRDCFASSDKWTKVREDIRQADEEVKLCLGRKEAHEKQLAVHLKAGAARGWMLSPHEEADPREGLRQQLADIQQKIEELDKERQLTGGILVAHRHSVAQIQAFQEELTAKEKDYRNWKELNDILGNANGDKFRETAQCFTLRFLIRQANEQLRLLNRRYSLEQVPDSLGIRVIDHDRGDEVRNISSLSGGETFLVSLALALGLSSLSSRNIPMGNLFVDEGFGTLDSSSLNLVIDALSSLHSMQGKKVGVISHTAEMKERIRTQIQVVKMGSGGRSALKISCGNQ